MEEERRAACAMKLKKLDEKQQQQQGSSSTTPSIDGNSTAATAGSPSPTMSASSPNISQPPSPCVDPEEPPLLAVQPGSSPGLGERQRASSNSSYDSTAGKMLKSFECFQHDLSSVRKLNVYHYQYLFYDIIMLSLNYQSKAYVCMSAI